MSTAIGRLGPRPCHRWFLRSAGRRTHPGSCSWCAFLAWPPTQGRAGQPRQRRDHAELDLLTGEVGDGVRGTGRGCRCRTAALPDRTSAQMAQQIPQLAAGMAGSLAGARAVRCSSSVRYRSSCLRARNRPYRPAWHAGQSVELATQGSRARIPADAVDTLDPMTEDLAAEIGDLDAFGRISAAPAPSAWSGGAATGAGVGGGAVPAVPLGPAAPPSAGTFLSSARSAAATTQRPDPRRWRAAGWPGCRWCRPPR